MNNLLSYPISCVVDRAIPKTAFYRNVEVSERMRRRFIEEVQEFRWLYKLAPQTLNVEGGDIEEVQIFLATLKRQTVPIELLQFIDKHMPQFTTFILQYGGSFCLLCNYKQFATQAHDRCDLIETFSTDWQKTAPILEIQGRTLPQIYEGFVRQIAGSRLEKTTTLAADVSGMQNREAIERRIAQLEMLMNKEPQPHRKFEIHQQIVELKNQL